MVFKVLLHPSAAKELRKLDQANQARMKKALEELAADPRKAGKPLRPSDYWGIRSGDYRAIYEIDSDLKQVIVLFIGHRKKVYADFSKLL
ncbi:MAG TPA: type II toxin-antitoxin system RelE/ParE family toxin [Candidatus Limnocylindrales bacterium]|nr:type II toxin-antitoxin system RelE/ParE family toxin [Candidatus Limnocylindrales bacterium]